MYSDKWTEIQLLQLSDYSQLLGFYGYVNRPKVLCFIPGGEENQMFSLLLSSKLICISFNSKVLRPFLQAPLETWLSSIICAIPHILPTLYFICMLMNRRFTAQEAAEM